MKTHQQRNAGFTRQTRSLNHRSKTYGRLTEEFKLPENATVLEMLTQSYEQAKNSCARQDALCRAIGITNAFLLAHLGVNNRLSKTLEDQVIEAGEWVLSTFEVNMIENVIDSWPQGPLLLRAYSSICEERWKTLMKHKASRLSDSVTLQLERVFSRILELQEDTRLTLVSEEHSTQIDLPRNTRRSEWKHHQFPLFAGFLGPVLESGDFASMLIHTHPKSGKDKVMGIAVDQFAFHTLPKKEVEWSYNTDHETGQPLPKDPSVIFAEFDLSGLNSPATPLPA